MKQTPTRIHLDTLGDLLERRTEGVIGGLEAWCWADRCPVVAVQINLDALASSRGLEYPWKSLKPVCKECGGDNTSISLRWTHTDSSTPD